MQYSPNQMMAHHSVAHKYCKGLTRERNIINHIDKNKCLHSLINKKYIFLAHYEKKMKYILGCEGGLYK